MKVQALAKTVVKTRTHGETGEPAHVVIPDHLDVLAELASGAQAHILLSDVIGKHCYEASDIVYKSHNVSCCG